MEYAYTHDALEVEQRRKQPKQDQEAILVASRDHGLWLLGRSVVAHSQSAEGETA